MDLGLGAIEAKASPAFARALGDAVKREQSEPASISLAEQSATQFRILFAAYLAAKARRRRACARERSPRRRR